MSQGFAERVAQVIVVKALREVFVEEPDKRRELRIQIARLEKEDPKTVEAFNVREEKIKGLLEELRSLGGRV